MKKLNILTVNYESKEFIINLIKKIDNEGIPYDFIIVNNSNESFDNITADNDKVIVIKNNLKIKNACLSHVSGLNLGLSNLNFNNKYTLICDPDISFSKNTVVDMINYMKNRDIDVMGISKITKKGNVLKYPYIWFTLIKTKYLQDFYFLYLPIKNNILIKAIRKLCRITGILPNIEDSGDSIYELIRDKHLKYYSIKPIKKEKLPKKYSFLKDINSIEYVWEGHIISHFNCGSKSRYSRIHKENDKDIFFRI
ncbi:conserved protein of unknown function [Methanocaldococcus lauensis]|nr:conserved protein of unknown function [Methanocaldococcus lauensis]